MRLFFIVEALNPQQLEKVADRTGLSVERIQRCLGIIERETGASFALPWVLRQIGEHNLRIPEDLNRIINAFKLFKEVKARLEIKDINRYPNLHAVEDAVESVKGQVSKRQGGNSVDFRKLSDVVAIKHHGNFTLTAVGNADSLAKVGEGTKWCTRASYDDCQAENYIDEHGYLYVVFDGLKPILQATPDFQQVMDRNDQEVVLPGWVFDYFNNSLSDADELLHLALNAKRRSSATEEAILAASDIDDFGDVNTAKPHAATIYAIECIRGRWPEAEEIILTDPWASLDYTKHVIGGRWERAEPIIASDWQAAMSYLHGLFSDIDDRFAATWSGHNELSVRLSYTELLNLGFEKLGSPIRFKLSHVRGCPVVKGSREEPLYSPK